MSTEQASTASSMITILVSISPIITCRLLTVRPAACSYQSSGETCQSRIFSIEGKKASNINVYDLNTVGATSMIDLNGVSVAQYSDNVDVFPDNIAVFTLE